MSNGVLNPPQQGDGVREMGAQGGEQSVVGIVGVAGDGDLRDIMLLQAGAGAVFLISRGLPENINILCRVKTIALIHVCQRIINYERPGWLSRDQLLGWGINK